MKRIKKSLSGSKVPDVQIRVGSLFAALLFVMGLWLGNLEGRAAAFSYDSGVVDIPIPDNDASGIVSSINVSGLSGSIADLTVTLDLRTSGAAGFNGDYYAYLAHDSIDRFAVLINRPGKTLLNEIGTDGSGFLNVRFSDDAANGDIHNYESTLGAGFTAGDSLTGTWAPDGRDVDPANVLDTDIRDSLLNSFEGQTGNGNWTLFVADVASGGTLTLEDWQLEIMVTPVPEPFHALFVAFGLGVFAVLRSRVRHDEQA